jgi:hypothetical protein
LSPYSGVLLPFFWPPTGQPEERSEERSKEHSEKHSAGSTAAAHQQHQQQWPRPQVLEADSILLALSFCSQLSSPAFHLGFDSIGATARTNRLHFHVWYHQVSSRLPM